MVAGVKLPGGVNWQKPLLKIKASAATEFRMGLGASPVDFQLYPLPLPPNAFSPYADLCLFFLVLLVPSATQQHTSPRSKGTFSLSAAKQSLSLQTKYHLPVTFAVLSRVRIP